jgi:hypothetical protein
MCITHLYYSENEGYCHDAVRDIGECPHYQTSLRALARPFLINRQSQNWSVPVAVILLSSPRWSKSCELPSPPLHLLKAG